MTRKKENQERKEAVIYARFSSSKQREESIAGQLRECHAFAEAEGLTVIHEYIDRAMSARTDQRPSFLEMIQDSDKKLFSYVIVYQLDRFSRSRYDSAVYKHRLKKNGVRVLSAKEHITSDPTGILLEALIEANAELYSAELSQKVNRGMLQNVLEGKWPGGNLPLGYRLNTEHKLVIEPEQAKTVHMIYDWFTDGVPMIEIIRRLNQRHRLTSFGRPFKRSSLNHVLENPIYIGTFTYKGKTYPNFAPTIIEEAQYYLASRILTRRKKTPVSARSEKFQLVGKLFCGACGQPMVGSSGTSRNGDHYYYYICSTRTHARDKRIPSTCRQRSVRKDWLEDFVYRLTVKILLDPDTRQAIARHCSQLQQELQTEDPEIPRLKQAIADTQLKLKNSVQAVEQGIFSETIARNIPHYEAEVKRLQQELREAELLQGGDPVPEPFIEYYLKSLLKQKKYDEQKLDIFQAFIHRIMLFDDRIGVQYRISKELKMPTKTVVMRCSNKPQLVGPLGFEPRTNRL